MHGPVSAPSDLPAWRTCSSKTPATTGDLMENALTVRRWFCLCAGLLSTLVVDERGLYTDDASSPCESSEELERETSRLRPWSRGSTSYMCMAGKFLSGLVAALRGDTIELRTPILFPDGGDIEDPLVSSAEADLI